MRRLLNFRFALASTGVERGKAGVGDVHAERSATLQELWNENSNSVDSSRYYTGRGESRTTLVYVLFD